MCKLQYSVCIIYMYIYIYIYIYIYMCVYIQPRELFMFVFEAIISTCTVRDVRCFKVMLHEHS